MKKIIPLLLLPLVSFGDFDTTDKNHLSQVASNIQTIESNLINNGSFTINPLQSIQYLYRDFTTAFLTSSSSWGGHFIKTVGNASAKFIQEFGANGWFPAVKASIGVIQADVGRIYTALTTVNDHLEIIEGDVSSIKDTTESIDTTLTAIHESLPTITDSIDSVKDQISSTFYDWFSIDSSWGDPYGSLHTYRTFTITEPWMFDVSKGPINNFLDLTRTDLMLELQNDFFYATYVYYISQLKLLENLGLNVSALYALNTQTLWDLHAATNYLQSTTNWLARIHDRIPTNLTVVVSNIASNASNDWHYTAATTLSSSPVLQNLSPDISRDVSQSYLLSPPTLTGDFKKDVILLLAHAQQVSASGSSVNMDILTNLQVVAGSILSAKERVDNAVSDQQQRNQQIADDGTAHEHDLDSIDHVFDLGSNNTSIRDASTRLSEIPSKLGDLNVSTAPSSGTLTIPAFSFGGYELHEFQVNVDYSEFLPYFEAVRRVFALFWFGFVVYLLLLFLKFGIQFLGRIAAYIDPRPFLNNVQAANALTV